MSASKHAVAPNDQISFREAKTEDLQNSDLLSQYFVSADSGIGRDLEITAMRSLLAACNGPGRTEIFAEGVNGSIGCLISENKPWDSAMLSVATKSLVVLASPPRGRSRYEMASRMLGHWLDAYAKSSEGLVTTRIPAGDTALLRALEEHGFYVLVPMVTLGRALESVEVTLPPGSSISTVKPEDIDPIEQVAATAFIWGRFSADASVPREAAEKVHRTWARNCCLGTYAKHVLVARGKNEVVGFIAMKFQMAGTVEVGSIELIATSETSRGEGIGRALVQAGCNWLAATAKYVVVRTELPNIPAVRMYEAQGFRAMNGSLYLSRWPRAAAPNPVHG
jgi:ribosomal protein S18 acetylase RimI-like enzyme